MKLIPANHLSVENLYVQEMAIHDQGAENMNNCRGLGVAPTLIQ